MTYMQKYIICGIILLMFFSCKKEDELEPNPALPNLFAPSLGANDKTSQLRNQFYSETGSYLLFTDTLKHDLIGTDIYNAPLYDTELLDLSYGINSTVRWEFSFVTMNKYEKQKEAVDLLKELLFPVFEKRFFPYSFLLVDTLTAYTWWTEEGSSEGWWGDGNEYDFYMGVRAWAISVSKLKEDGEGVIQRMLMQYMKKSLTNDRLKKFYESGENYYGKYFEDIADIFGSEEEFIGATGILAYEYDDSYGYIMVGNQQEDLDTYLSEMLSSTESEFKTKYKDSDTVIEKYDILKSVLLDVGFDMDTVFGK